jgi:hypothetical protein
MAKASTGAGKQAAYERFGVPSYWILNPDPPQPELTVFELRTAVTLLWPKHLTCGLRR